MDRDDTYQSLRSVFHEWPGFLVNPKFIMRGEEITWSQYSRPMLKYPIRISHVLDMAERAQYTFQVIEDGSLFQMFYRFQNRGRRLVAASLAYYNAGSKNNILAEISLQPVEVDDNQRQEIVIPQEELMQNNELEQELREWDEEPEEEEEQEELEEDIVVPIEEKPLLWEDGPVAWLRIDYSPEQSRGILHYDCHMHVSLFPDARIAVSSVPNPKQFVEFIISLCYPEVYKSHRLNEEGDFLDEGMIRAINRPLIDLSNSQVCSHMFHVRIPFRA